MKSSSRTALCGFPRDFEQKNKTRSRVNQEYAKVRETVDFNYQIYKSGHTQRDDIYKRGGVRKDDIHGEGRGDREGKGDTCDIHGKATYTRKDTRKWNILYARRDMHGEGTLTRDNKHKEETYTKEKIHGKLTCMERREGYTRRGEK